MLSQPQNNYSSPPPPPRQIYSYPPPEASEGNNVRLPPMSSLLARHEHIGQEPKTFPYTAPPFQLQPHSTNPSNPNEMNQTALPHRSYHEPHSSHGTPSHQHAQPVLTTSQRLPSLTEMHYDSPFDQARQARKLSLRKDDFKTDHGFMNSPTAPLQDRYSALSTVPQQYMQQEAHYPQSRHSISSESSMISPRNVSFSPRNGPTHSLPMSSLIVQQNNIQVNYTLTVRQQPQSARACGFGERDRRVIDPPPILVLDIDRPVQRAELYVVNCTLWDSQSDEDASAMPLSTERRQQRRLMGSLVSNPFLGKDENNAETCYFTFPDLSVRTPGTYSLKFDLVVLDQMNMSTKGYAAPIRASVKSDPFQVYNAKDFGGMRPSTSLTKSLKAQGCLIPVKKGNSKTNKKDGGDDDDDMDGDDDDDGDDDLAKSNTKGKKRAKR